MQKDRSMPKKACFRKADDRSFYRANARIPKKRSFFGMGTAKSVASSRAVQGEGRQERKAGAKAEAFRSWERRRMYCRAEPWRANAGSNGEESRAVQAKAGKREKPERKQRLFGLGNGEGCTVEQSRGGRTPEATAKKVEPCRRRPAREKSRSESRGFSVLETAKSVASSRAVQAKATNFHDVLDFISDIPKQLFLPHGGDEGLHQWAECSRHRGSSVYRRRYP